MHRKAFVHLAACALAGAGLGLPGPLLAADRGTRPEAEALVRKAAALIRSAGADKTFEEITNGQAFKDRDLYVFVYDLNGRCLAHGANARLVGRDLIGQRDADGRPLVQVLVDIARDKGQGWTQTVKIRDPVTDRIRTRVNYIERVGDFAVGSGVFTD